MSKIEIKKDLKALNNEIAAENRDVFKKNNIYTINIMGSPGAGKTTLLENILKPLADSFSIAVIEGDLATANDSERIKKLGVEALQINTDGGCHLDARMIQEELSKIDLNDINLLIIENVGNLVCPISYDLGEDLRLVVLSTPEGEDKPLKYPPAMLNTDAVVLTKIDLAQFVDVNMENMEKNIKDINPKADILKAGKRDGVYNADSVTEYIVKRVGSKKEQ
jgi:hydrogenase nickel incorporation protein HypB